MNTRMRCPQCGEAITQDKDSRCRPFCSERCRLIDLGEWASETYSIAGKPQPFSDANPDDDASGY